eukprot:Clim_evm16s231 gene=Clim_evmTU16s231
MEVLKADAGVLTNFEVLDLVREVRSKAATVRMSTLGSVEDLLDETNKPNGKKDTATNGSSSANEASNNDGSGSPLPRESYRPQHKSLMTVTYEVQQYLEETSCVAQTADIVIAAKDTFRGLELRDEEIIQIINSRPANLVELAITIPDMDERFSEEALDQILNTIADTLPSEQSLDVPKEPIVEDEDVKDVKSEDGK